MIPKGIANIDSTGGRLKSRITDLRSEIMCGAYGFEFASRVGEYTHSEPNQQDQCARTGDFTFAVEIAGVERNILGSALASLPLQDFSEGRRSILECRVKTVTSKSKTVAKPKVIAPRSPEESAYLDDLALWFIHSGNASTDEAFSFHKTDGSVSVLTGRAVRDELKRTCDLNGLPPP